MNGSRSVYQSGHCKNRCLHIRADTMFFQRGGSYGTDTGRSDSAQRLGRDGSNKIIGR